MDSRAVQLVTNEDKPETRRRFALIVGISEFNLSQFFRSLPLASKDAQDLNTFLSHEAGYEKVVLLLDEKATYAGILGALKQLFNQLSAQDTLLFYYSGHGYRDTDGRSYLVPYDVSPQNSELTDIANLLSMQEDILSLLHKQPINAMVIIVDACHPNNLPDESKGFAFPLSMPENIAGMAAARPGELAYETKELHNGIFTYFLLEGLKGEADRERKRIVTIFDLHRYVSRKVRDYMTQRDFKQTPILNYIGSEDIVIGSYLKPQAELDAERKKNEVDRLFKQLESHSRQEEWEKVLADWDKLLELDPNPKKFPDPVLRARQELDKDGDPFEKEKAESIKTYPRIWPCWRNEQQIGTGYNIFLTHPDVHKGDILIECEKTKDGTTKFANVQLAKIDGVPITDKAQKIHYYVTAKTIVGLDNPPLSLSQLTRSRDNTIKNIVQEWDNFEKWTQDLRAVGAWNELRQFIFRNRPNGIANSVVEAEFKPLEYGLKNYPDTQELHEAANQLLDSYKNWVSLSTIQDLKSRIPQIEPKLGETEFKTDQKDIRDNPSTTPINVTSELNSSGVSNLDTTTEPTIPQATVPSIISQPEIQAEQFTPEIFTNTNPDSGDGISNQMMDVIESSSSISNPEGETQSESKKISDQPEKQKDAPVTPVVLTKKDTEDNPSTTPIDVTSELNSSSVSNLNRTTEPTTPQATVPSTISQPEMQPEQITQKISTNTNPDSGDESSKKLSEEFSKLLGKPVRAGEPLDLGATRVRSQLSDELSPATQIVWRQVIAPAIQSNARVQNTHTINIHISPSISNLESKTGAAKTPTEESKYMVVLTLMEKIDEKPQVRMSEGPLKLNMKNLENEPFGSARYGAVLHHALFHDEEPENRERVLEGFTGRHTLKMMYSWALARSSLTDKVSRVQLRINTDVTELHDLPWEYLWDVANPEIGSLACSAKTPFARVLHVSSSTDTHHPPIIASNSPMRLLAVLSSPPELNKEQVKDEDMKGLLPIPLRQIEVLKENLSKVGQLLEPLEGENLLASSNERVSLAAIRQRLQQAEEQKRPFHVLHLLCHGTIWRANAKASLLLQQEDSDDGEWVTDQTFADLLLQFPKLRLVVLASCLTALQTHNNSLKGVARQLVDKGIPAVIAMQGPLEFRSAQHFSHRLYTQLLYHGEIDRAVNAARNELYNRVKHKAKPDDPEVVPPKEWGYPVLFMRLPNGRLFQIDEATKAASKPDAPVEILPFGEQSGKATQELVEGMLKAFVRQYSLNLDEHQLALLQAFSEAFTATPENRLSIIPDLRVPTKQLPLFSRPGEEQRRWALIQSVKLYRGHSGRRKALYFRALARSKVVKLVNLSQIENLTLQCYRDEIWSGGFVKLNDLQVKNLWSELAKTPITSDLLNADLQGNLTWLDGERAAPTNLDTTALKVLLGQQSKAFQTFSKLTQPENYPTTGLDEQTTSFLLHTTHPDIYIPYHQKLAQTVFHLLLLPKEPSFQNYCLLAQQLLQDEDLGFENLADVGYFLQQLGEKAIPFAQISDYPENCKLSLEKVRLQHDHIYSQLITPPEATAQISAALNANKHIILTGPPGTGKTTLAEDVCRYAQDCNYNRGHILVTATADWTTFDTIGGYTPQPGNRLVFRPGIFLQAIASQKWLIIDEINRADIDKAFGELLTVLSGQVVTLPYEHEGRLVRILPPGYPTSERTLDYSIHSSWRVIGTMNVYDKASLFAMSYAFMRRFALVRVNLPSSEAYHNLILNFLRAAGFNPEEPRYTGLIEDLCRLFNQNQTDNYLMESRALGPAIAKDIVMYLHQRAGISNKLLDYDYLAEALMLYVVPQLDGLERDQVIKIYKQFYTLLNVKAQTSCKTLLDSIEELFPFINKREWQQAFERGENL